MLHFQFTVKTLFALTISFGLTACGTLTGIPGHGGGKRFATEQRLVSASIRHALKEIDVSPIRGKKAAVVFDLIKDLCTTSLNQPFPSK